MTRTQTLHARACRALTKLAQVNTTDRVRCIVLMELIGIDRPTDQARFTACEKNEVVKARGAAQFFLDDLRG